MMKIDYDSCSKLCDIHFKYERLGSLISCLRSLVAEVAEVRGVPEHAIEYSLYEIEMEIDRNNKEFGELIDGERCIQEVAS